MQRMQTWIARYPVVGDVRGRGLMIRVEIVSDQESRTPAGHERDAIIKHAFERGVLCLGAGPNTIRLSPPLIVSQEQAGTALDILEDCIGQVSSGGGSQNRTPRIRTVERNISALAAQTKVKSSRRSRRSFDS